MRLITYLCILILLAGSNILLAQDTLSSNIDTTICGAYQEAYSFHSPYDTSSYNSEWYNFNEDFPFSTEDSIFIQENTDTLILISTPINPMDTVRADTIYIKLRFSPDISFDIPPTECFTGDSISILDRSDLFGDYTVVTYNGNLANGDTIKEYVDNGSSLDVLVNYSISECMVTIDTLITLMTEFQPISSFTSNDVCFGDNTIIINNSEHDSTISLFSLEIEGLIGYNSSLPSYAVTLPQNGESRNVFVSITEGNCSEKDTFEIRNKLQPTAIFDTTSTCENEMLRVVNGSSDITSDPTYTININSQEYTFMQSSEFTISDTLADNTYTALGIVDNNNGCIDSLNFSVVIDSVTYVSFSGLEDFYCERQDISPLIANISEGQFSELFITDDLGTGQATFAPTMPGENIEVTFSFTNEFGCTDVDTQVVTTVHPKPDFQLLGLEATYCELDPASDLMLNPTVASNTMASYEISKDGVIMYNQDSFDYTFDPIESGSYSILNIYTDANGCFDSVINTTIVNPLPRVQLDSLEILIPGDDVLIGNQDSMPDPAVDFKWSNGSNEPSIEVSQPGIYFLTGTNGDTGCFAFDSIRIEFDPTVQDTLVGVQISPNPTMDQVTITLTAPAQNIRIVDVFGQSISLGGVSSFSTDNSNQLSLDMSNNASGYYYILIPNVGNFLLLKI